MRRLLDRARALEADLVKLRRELHRHPELSFQEFRTADTAAAGLAGMGYRLRTGVGRTGVVAELGEGRPIVALRADMDALPIAEENDVPYRSLVPGAMHACGHDAHVAMLMGAARLLAEARREGELPPGTVRLLFQPSEEASDEENLSGAARMLGDGAMEGVGAVFGLHVGAHLESGTAYVSSGPIMAGSDVFRGRIEGVSAHAARPHEGVDAVLLAAHVLVAIQHAVARRISPLSAGVVSVGTVAGGVAENVLAAEVSVTGTLRYLDDDVRATLRAAVGDAFRVADALGGRGAVEFASGYPPVVNDRGMADLVRRAAANLLGSDSVREFEPELTAEDFGLFLKEVPGAFIWLGAALDPPRQHHHPRFDIDERVLPRGAALLSALALTALQELEP